MKKKEKSFGEAIAVGTAIAGAALGAAAVLLSDKKNQDKIKKTIDNFSDESIKFGKNLKQKAEEFAGTASHEEKKAEKEVKKTVKKATTTVKKEAKKQKVYTPLKKS